MMQYLFSPIRRPALDAGLGFFCSAGEKSLTPFDAACGVAQNRPSQAWGDEKLEVSCNFSGGQLSQ
jgi:hypothetical protein